MSKIKELIKKHYEVIAYLFFGGVTTLVNIAVYFVLSQMGMSTFFSNAIAWVVSVTVAYITNRIWVFRSKSAGRDAVKEIASFVACRVGTGVMDQILMVLGVDVLGPVIAGSHMRVWSLGVKVFSNILVIVLNYVFSKLMIFKKKAD